MKKKLIVIFSLFLIGCRWCCWCNCNRRNSSPRSKPKGSRNPGNIRVTATTQKDDSTSPNTPKFRRSVGSLRKKIEAATTVEQAEHLLSVAKQRSAKLAPFAQSKLDELLEKADSKESTD